MHPLCQCVQCWNMRLVPSWNVQDQHRVDSSRFNGWLHPLFHLPGRPIPQVSQCTHKPFIFAAPIEPRYALTACTLLCCFGLSGCGGSSAGTCADCPAGKYKAQKGAAACTDCEAGKWSKPSSTNCTLFSVGITVKLPYTKAEFDAAKQAAFRAAVASAAGVSATDVVIVSIKETLRRSGSIDVETNIIAADSAGADTVSTTLGSGDALKGKLTTSLQAEGLQAPTGVTDPPSTGTCNKQCDKIVADTEVTSVYGGKVLHLKIRHPDIGEAV